MPQIFQLQGFCPDHYINSHLFQPVPPLWKAAPSLHRARNSSCSSGPCCECASRWHLLGTTSTSQSSKGRVCFPIQTCLCPWERPPKPLCPSPACVNCRTSSLAHTWKDHPWRACSVQQLVRKPAGSWRRPGHRQMSWPAEPTCPCWQSPWRGLLCVWPVRVPCGAAGITGFDLARASG